MSVLPVADRFSRHRALILVAAGGAVAEAGLLTLVAPAARPIAPQVTALPTLAAYHDLRWLFADGQSWVAFAAVVLAVVLARSAMDTVLLRLAWPDRDRRPRAARAFASSLALTLLAWLLLSPVATLAFGVAVLPFSWPFIAALPIMIGMMLVLSHGGVIPGWWRRLPPLRSVGWLCGSFLVLSAAAEVTAHLNTGAADTAAALAIAAGAGVANARAWYGMTRVAAGLQPREHVSVPAKVIFGLPFAPIAAVLVLALVVGVARLMLTGTIKLSLYPSAPSASASLSPKVSAHSRHAGSTRAGDANAPAGNAPVGNTAAGEAAGAKRAADTGSASTAPGSTAPGKGATAVLVVAGWGSSCCHAADALRAVTPGKVVRQFSYVGLSRTGQPLPNGPDQDDVALPALGDKIAAQLTTLHDQTGGRVDVVAESEGTLGVYAMLDRHPGLPIGSIALLSPIVEPGQVTYPAGTAALPVPAYALSTLNNLVGGMSPYGPAGAAKLLTSVGEYGAQYFDRLTTSAGTGIRWLAVIPLADALTLPSCALPQDVLLAPAFHGGLLGDPSVLPTVSSFLAGHRVASAAQDDSGLRTEAGLITGAAEAWRMPQTSAACP